MRREIRVLLFFEAATFVFASLIHSGVLITGYEHPKARIPEGIIAVVLLLAAVSIWIRPEWTRKAGLAAQAFAFLGTLIGLFTVVIGIGPNTIPDIVYHFAIIAVLVSGLIFTDRISA